MSEFSEYEAVRPKGVRPAVGLIIEEANQTDLSAVASLSAEREGGSPGAHLELLEREFTDAARRLFVARLDSQVVAFSRVSRLGFDTIPRGWYLTGLVVSRAHRRRGIGRALTDHRLRWLASRADEVFYFANERNRPTLDLHGEFGFREVERGISVPGCNFEGGEGVLFRLDLRHAPHRSAADRKT